MTMATPEKPTPATTDRQNETAAPAVTPVIGLVTLPEPVGETTITGKNQISLPAEAVRRLGWQKGDRIIVKIQGYRMILWRRPASWTEYFAGKMGDVFGDHDDTIRFLEEERRSWEEWAEERGI